MSYSTIHFCKKIKESRELVLSKAENATYKMLSQEDGDLGVQTKATHSR